MSVCPALLFVYLIAASKVPGTLHTNFVKDALSTTRLPQHALYLVQVELALAAACLYCAN